MPGWRRNQRTGTPAAALAVPSPARPRDDWRTLPPPPTVLRSAATTVDAGAFRDRLSSWRDPSFLAPLRHQIDPGGPVGLVTGLACPQPQTYYRGRPLPLATRPPAPVQRSAVPRNPSALTAALDVDLAPVSLPAIPAEPELTSTDLVGAMAHEPPGLPAEPSAENPEMPVAGPDQPGEAPLVSHREAGPVTAQRQLAPDPPQPPLKHRLGLGAPLNNPAGSQAPAVPVPGPPLVARSVAAPSPNTASRTPRRLVLPEPASPSAGPAERIPPIPVSVQPAPADPAPRPRPEPPNPASAGDTQAADAPTWATPSGEALVPIEPVGHTPHGDAAPADGPPGPLPAEAPLTGALPLVTHAIEPFIPHTTAPFLPGPTPLPAAQAAIQRSVLPVRGPASAAWGAVQESVPSAEAPPGNPQTRPPAPASASRPATAPTSAAQPVTPPARPPAVPGPVPALVTPDPGPAYPPAGPLDLLLVTAQRLPPVPPVPTAIPPGPEFAPLLGDRPPARVLDAPPAPGSQPAPATRVADIPRGTPVQRSVQTPVPLSQPGGRADVTPGGPAPGAQEPAAAFVDPGAIAVTRGLAHRDPDGSVIFDLGPAPAPSLPLPETVQRQDASGPPGAPGPSPGSEPPAAAALSPSVQATATAPAVGHAPAPASPPLDELARQLFGPLSARLKAELRLDRERAGLLTDLRQ